MEIVAGSPFGGVLLGLIALGFLGYALWRAIQAIADPDGEGTDVKGIGKRAGYGVSALVYAGLASSALGLILGSASQGNGTPDDWTARLLSWPLGQALVVCVSLGGALGTLARQPFGAWLLGAVALGLVAYGLFMLLVARYRHINTGSRSNRA